MGQVDKLWLQYPTTSLSLLKTIYNFLRCHSNPPLHALIMCTPAGATDVRGPSWPGLSIGSVLTPDSAFSIYCPNLGHHQSLMSWVQSTLTFFHINVLAVDSLGLWGPAAHLHRLKQIITCLSLHSVASMEHPLLMPGNRLETVTSNQASFVLCYVYVCW